MSNRVFSREEVDRLLGAVRGLTLGQADTRGLIDIAHEANPDKVQKGIAGDVIELSVLGCDNRDSKPEPDITVDGTRTELKTTGVIKAKQESGAEYEAKEPLAITGVSPSTIVNEVFDTSRFAHKIEHLLFVFYYYSLSETAKCSLDYKSFPILGHLFWEVPKEEREKLKNDWSLVREFAQKYSFDNEEERHKLKANLLLIDYASPKQPRFRFKRSYVTTIVESFLNGQKYQTLPRPIEKFSDIDEKCHVFTEKYKGKTIGEIAKALGFRIKASQKDLSQQIVIRMFGGEASSLNKIRDFSEIGLVAKTIILTHGGQRTEDMKLFSIDFNEWLDPNTTFSDVSKEDQESLFYAPYSHMYSYFAEQSFLFIMFQEPEPGPGIPISRSRFVGFKRYSFSDKFIMTEAKRTWEESRELVLSGKLENVAASRGYAPNFPKSRDHILFMRGSGTDGFDKKPVLSKWGYDFEMYVQWIWIKGSYITEELNKIEYL